VWKVQNVTEGVAYFTLCHFTLLSCMVVFNNSLVSRLRINQYFNNYLLLSKTLNLKLSFNTFLNDFSSVPNSYIWDLNFIGSFLEFIFTISYRHFIPLTFYFYFWGILPINIDSEFLFTNWKLNIFFNSNILSFTP